MTQQLRIKRKHLESIVSGKKRTEYRDFTQHYVSRFYIETPDGDGDTNATPRTDIEAIRFYCPTPELLLFAVVELKSIDYDEAANVIELHLGRIVETNARPKLSKA